MINQFMTVPGTAMDELCAQAYSLQDIKHITARWWVQHMLHLARSLDLPLYGQLTMIHGRLHPNLQRDIPGPKPSTTLIQFKEQLDDITPACYAWSIVPRPRKHQSYVLCTVRYSLERVRGETNFGAGFVTVWHQAGLLSNDVQCLIVVP